MLFPLQGNSGGSEAFTEQAVHGRALVQTSGRHLSGLVSTGDFLWQLHHFNTSLKAPLSNCLIKLLFLKKKKNKIEGKIECNGF